MPVSVYESSVITGAVTKISDGTPIVGATVEYSGTLSGDVITDASGNYSFTAINGDYAVRAGMTGYALSDIVNLTTPPNGTANFQLGAAIIALNPTNVILSAYKNVIATNSFAVTNSGNLPLHVQFLPGEGVDWLSVAPEMVTLAVGASTQIVASAAAGEMVGTYNTVLDVVSDDPINPSITMPVSLTVLGNPTNHPPVVSNATVVVDEDSGYTDAGIAYYDADADVVQIEVVAEPLHGNLIVGAAYILYSPDANYFGEDSFTYRMHDYEEYGNTATALVTVVGQPDAPTVSLLTPTDDSFYDANVVIDFSANVYDVDGNDTVSSVVFETTNGITIGSGIYDGTNTHTLSSELVAGVHGWRAVATDDTGLAVTSTVRKITIAGNNPPVADAGPDCYVAAGQLAYLDGSGSSDPDNAQETLSFVWTQTGGPAITLIDGTNMVASYMAESSGPHYFQLVVSDAEFDRTDTVTQTVNIVPVADDMLVQTFENTAINIIPTFSDSDGPSNEFVSVSDPLYGTFGLCDGNSFIYIPNDFVGGVYDHFDYIVNDGISNSAPATITILIGELNGTNMVPYRESFESFLPGPSILGRKGWLAGDPEVASISTNEAALSSLAGYAGSYPLNDAHTKLLQIEGPVTNLVTTHNLPSEDIRFDCMIMPAHWDVDLIPEVAEGAQVGLYFNVDGLAVVWARPASGQEPQWNTLTNAAVLSTSTWARVTIDQLYSQGESLFSVALDSAAPIVDETIGTNVAPDTEKCWFIAADQSNDYMTDIVMGGGAYGDDMVVNLVDTNSFLSWMTEAYPGDTNYNATAGEDTDGDGHDSAQEYAAGTDPNNATSVFELSTIEPKVGDELVLNWSSVAGKFYAIQYGSNLLAGLNSDGNSNIVATPPMNSYTVTVGEAAPTLFYRVIVEQ